MLMITLVEKYTGNLLSRSPFSTGELKQEINGKLRKKFERSDISISQGNCLFFLPQHFSNSIEKCFAKKSDQKCIDFVTCA